MKFLRCLSVFVLLAALLPPVVAAQPAVSQQQSSSIPTTEQVLLAASASRKSVEVVRTEVAPKIDGVLDDELWKRATVIADLHQYQPVDHGEPSEKSEFYLAYSERFLYIAARLYDSNPELISARQLVQGQGMPFDDAFEFILDTFNTGRTGYQFQVNPNGIRREGLYENPRNLNNDWTGIWLVESRIDDKGWTAEVAIPFNTLNFDPTSTEWGFTIARTIARKQEELAWSSFNRDINPSTTGLLTGIRDIRQGVGLDVIPSIAMAMNEDYVAGTTSDRIDPSVNVFYKFTPNLTGALTLNTDFSATEVDNRQVNLSRFSLFFPEKRDFFLQDVDIFSFGGRTGGGGFGGGGGGNNQNGIPFYSRRIGLSSVGQPVDIEAGAKVTGRVGQWNLGALAVQQGENGALDSKALFVGRATANVLSESNVGVIFTSGNPNSDIDNSLVGADFRYQNTRFSPSHTLRSDVWVQQTDTKGRTGDDRAYGYNVNMDTQNNGFGGGTGYYHFGEAYNPALGFANRVGIDTFWVGGSGRYFLQGNPLIRLINAFTRFEHIKDSKTGEMQSESWFMRPLNINTHRGDQFGLGMARNREGLTKPFEISPGIFIPVGKYAFTEYNVEMGLSNQRDFSPNIQLATGEFYDGNRDRIRVGFDWRPEEHFNFGWNYDYQQIELPAGNFDVRLVTANANYAFNAKWSWVNLVQYDNSSSSMGLNSRLRWNPQAGEDLYIVFNYNFDSEGVFSKVSSEKAELALKYTKTFRY
jgi:hypothetical protein